MRLVQIMSGGEYNPKDKLKGGVLQGRIKRKLRNVDAPTIDLPRNYESAEGEKIRFKISRGKTLKIYCDGEFYESFRIDELPLNSLEEGLRSLADSKADISEIVNYLEELYPRSEHAPEERAIGNAGGKP